MENNKRQEMMEAAGIKCLRREFAPQARAVSVEGSDVQELWVEGYAVRFSSPTVLFEYDGIEYKEQVLPDAFSEARMDDVIFNYNHGGKVMARTRNNTLQLHLDGQGLLIRARLDGTEEGQQMYREIQGGYVDRMSFQFTIREESYDKDNHMWTIQKVKRLYDVSAVDIPAYDDTSIEARKAFVLEADAQSKEAAAADVAIERQKLELKLKL